MASSKTKSKEVELDDAESAEEVDDSLEEPAGDVLEAEVDANDDDWDESSDEKDSDDDDDDEKPATETAEDLDELESEELEMLTEDELAETLVVDEAAELRAIRRAELAMSAETGSERTEDEFLCQGCFLVLKSSQLSDKRRKLCVDCAG